MCFLLDLEGFKQEFEKFNKEFSTNHLFQLVDLKN